MIKSMTGYGRFEQVDESKKIVIDLKSVNHRYCDVNIKVPRAYGYVEDKIREYVLGAISRGKVDVFVYIENYTNQDKVVMLDKVLCQNYYNVLAEMKSTFGLADEIGLPELMRFNDVFITKQQDEDKEQVWQTILACLEPAMKDFIAMRSREGERILCDIKGKAKNMRALIQKVEELAPQVVEDYAKRIRERMTELLGEFQVDENRLLTEVGIMADRVAIDEELVRLASHFDELDKILAQDEPVGRKLDFLVQEINRETNTIGSKANDVRRAKIVVEMKSEIEKLREQIQNIE